MKTIEFQDGDKYDLNLMLLFFIKVIVDMEDHISRNVRYKRIEHDPSVGEGLTRELNVTGYVKANAFPIKYKKIITKLNPRSAEVDNAIRALRSYERNGTTTGLIIEHLTEACLINKYNLEYEIDTFPTFDEFERFVDLRGDDLKRLIFRMMDGDYCHNDEEIIIYAYFKTILHIKGFAEDTTVVKYMMRDSHIPIIINYIKEELIPQSNVTGEVSFEPAYLTVRENYALRSGPDFVIDGNIIEMKVAAKNTWINWARQLYLYADGMRQNHIPYGKCYILNVYSNEMIEFTFE